MQYYGTEFCFRGFDMARGKLYYNIYIYICIDVLYYIYYLMLTRSALRDLWHEGCG